MKNQHTPGPWGGDYKPIFGLYRDEWEAGLATLAVGLLTFAGVWLAMALAL
jgi:hypothetical protein